MVQNNPTPFDVGRAFVHQYYTLLHQAPELLHRFYSKESTFIHGGVDRPGLVEQPAVGPEDIARRIEELNLHDCHAKIRQVDSHPTIGQGVVVQVTGELSNNGHSMRRFMQTFVLAPRQPKKYYVQNDIFRYQDEVFDEGSDEDDRSSSQIYGDTDKVSNADSSVAQQQQQPVQEPQSTVTVPSVRLVNEEQQHHQQLPPRNQQQTEVPSKVQEQTLNGVNESSGYNDQQEAVQDTQQQSKQSVSLEGASYAGIAKLKSATGQTVTPVPPVQQPAVVRSAPTKPSAPQTRPTTGNQQQQQRGSGNNYQQNVRGNNQWNENNAQQDQSPARRPGSNVMSAPNEQQVFVGSLPLEFTREDLLECFTQFGRVLDAKIHQPNYDNKKNFGFVLFDNAETASEVVKLQHINYKNIRLNVEPKTQRSFSGNGNNGSQGNPRNYQSRNSGGSNRGGNRGGFRGNPNNPRRGGGQQYGMNSPSATPVDDNPKY